MHDFFPESGQENRSQKEVADTVGLNVFACKETISCLTQANCRSTKFVASLEG
jgi:hypothetical protein